MQKKGKKERQQEALPELKKEIAEARGKLGEPPQWPDQRAAAYKAHLEERCRDKVAHLEHAKRKSFLSRIIRALSCCFWVHGVLFATSRGV